MIGTCSTSAQKVRIGFPFSSFWTTVSIERTSCATTLVTPSEGTFWVRSGSWSCKIARSTDGLKEGSEKTWELNLTAPSGCFTYSPSTYGTRRYKISFSATTVIDITTQLASHNQSARHLLIGSASPSDISESISGPQTCTYSALSSPI